MLKRLRRLNNESDSLQITIPKYLVDLFDLKYGQKVDLTVKGKKIILNTDITDIEDTQEND